MEADWSLDQELNQDHSSRSMPFNHWACRHQQATRTEKLVMGEAWLGRDQQAAGRISWQHGVFLESNAIKWTSVESRDLILIIVNWNLVFNCSSKMSINCMIFCTIGANSEACGTHYLWHYSHKLFSIAHVYGILDRYVWTFSQSSQSWSEKWTHLSRKHWSLLNTVLLEGKNSQA